MALELIQPLHDAFKEHSTSYTNRGSDYSVTEILKPPRIVQLLKRYKHEISKEVSIIKSVGSFRGVAIHDRFQKLLYRVISKQGSDDYMVESRLWDRILGRKISGQIDCLYKDILYDFKTTSVWKRIFGDFLEWEEQLNLYAYMLSLIGINVQQINVIAWYQDWDKMKAFDRQYPKLEMEQITMMLWPVGDQEEFMHRRIQLQIEAETLPDYDLPFCTIKDMWAKDDAWAVYKLTKQGKLPSKASRVLPSSYAAEEWISDQKGTGYKVVPRPGGRTRCEDWCDVSEFCNQYQEYKGEV